MRVAGRVAAQAMAAAAEVIAPGVTTDEIDSLLDDMGEAIDFLDRHPVTVKMTQEEGTSFTH